MDAILLAAGNSRRFGANKLLYEIDGKPMYCHVLEHLCCLQEENKLDYLIVVTQYRRIEMQIFACYPKVRVIHNEYPERGISYSICLGLQELKRTAPESEACLFSVGDQPYIKKESIEGLIQAWEESPKRIAACASGENSGNPVIFSEHYYEQLLSLTGDKGGKQVVIQNLEDVLLYQVTKKELEDVDVQSI